MICDLMICDLFFGACAQHFQPLTMQQRICQGYNLFIINYLRSSLSCIMYGIVQLMCDFKFFKN